MGGEIALMIPIVALLSIAAIFLAHSPVGKALATRWGPAEPDAALRSAFDEQAARLMVAEDEIEKLGERLEFTERLIASRPAPRQVSEPSQPSSLSASGDE